jgi:hypothetical protein
MNADIEMGDTLNFLGQEIAVILNRHPDGSFLYAEVDDEGYEVSIFVEDNGEVHYHYPSDKMFELVKHLWNVADDDKKWSVLEYSVVDGKFDAQFTFPDQLNADEDDGDDMCDRALRKRYGDKPVIYPDLGSRAAKLTLDNFADIEDEN